jgi:hypothetical protein
VLIINLGQHLAPLQPPPSSKRSHIVPTTHTHATDEYGATPLFRQVGGGCYSQGGVLPPHTSGEDLDIVFHKCYVRRVKEEEDHMCYEGAHVPHVGLRRCHDYSPTKLPLLCNTIIFAKKLN